LKIKSKTKNPLDQSWMFLVVKDNKIITRCNKNIKRQYNLFFYFVMIMSVFGIAVAGCFIKKQKQKTNKNKKKWVIV
jgi:hypothetical protein